MQTTKDTGTRRFGLDADRLARFLFERGDDVFGLDPHDEQGLSGALVRRFADAGEAGALLGPPGVTAVLYPLAHDGLILALREQRFPVDVRWPLRQVSTFCFEAREVACPHDESFAECCKALRELLARADLLLPAFSALTGAAR
jgi:hypothetical protein